MPRGSLLSIFGLNFLCVNCLSTILLRDGLHQQIYSKRCEVSSRTKIFSLPDANASPVPSPLAHQKIPDTKYEDYVPSQQQKSSLNLLGGLQNAFTAASRMIVPEDSFGWAVRSPAFVDKTMFIKHFIMDTNHTLVLAPNNFGKSTILSMLSDFLEMHVDVLGVVQDNRTSPNFKTFQKLAIYREDPTFFYEHFANYTVLRIDFADLNMQSRRDFVHSFRRMVNRLFSAHPYLLQSDRLTKSQRDKFEMYSYPRCQMSHEDLSSGGRVLSQLIFKHFHKRSIVLVDHVDAPAASLMLNEDATDAERTLTILSKFVAKLLRNNHQVYRALFTGILSVGNVYTREADTLDYRPVFGDFGIGRYFALTDQEVRELLVKFNRNTTLDGVQRMFGGYRVKNSHDILYNFKSVTKYLASGEFSRETKTTPGLQELKPALEYHIFGKGIEDSLESETPITLRLQFHEKHLYTLRPLMYPNLLKKQSKDNLLALQHRLLQFLLENGYYTVRRYVSNNGVRVVVPNEEVKTELKRLIYTKKFFTDKFRIEDSTLVEYVMAIYKLTKNQTSFETLCAAVSSIFAHEMPERAFEVQGPLFMYPALFQGAFKEVYSELNSDGDRRADVFIRRNDGAVIVMELVVEGDVFGALKQIVTHAYYAGKIDQPKKRIYIGIGVDRYRRCNISYLWNSDDLTKAKNVSFRPD